MARWLFCYKGDLRDSEICFCSLLEGKQKSLWSTALDWYSGQIQDLQCEVSALVPLYLRGFELFWIEQAKNLILSLPRVCILGIQHESLVTSLFSTDTVPYLSETFTMEKWISGKCTRDVKVDIQHNCSDEFSCLLH